MDDPNSAGTRPPTLPPPDRAPGWPPPGADRLQAAILAWYGRRPRSLPFRGSRDPYAILVSEVMAQQTQAHRAGEAWTRFMATYPTIEDLAEASPADVIRAWRGLGYNRRALNLWRAAGRIVEDCGGQVPATIAELEGLPGVGPYTARAVAALAFGAPVGPVDTNVRRVLGRIVAGGDRRLAGTALQAVADALVPPGRAADWTHALMDLGATVCDPRRPRCGECPARTACRYEATESGSSRDPRLAPDPKPAGAPRPVRRTGAFPATSRWLRGRILDRLRDAPDGRWLTLDEAIGGHDRAAVATAASGLARDGLVELERTAEGDIRARLALA